MAVLVLGLYGVWVWAMTKVVWGWGGSSMHWCMYREYLRKMTREELMWIEPVCIVWYVGTPTILDFGRSGCECGKGKSSVFCSEQQQQQWRLTPTIHRCRPLITKTHQVTHHIMPENCQCAWVHHRRSHSLAGNRHSTEMKRHHLTPSPWCQPLNRIEFLDRLWLADMTSWHSSSGGWRWSWISTAFDHFCVFLFPNSRAGEKKENMSLM